MKIEVSIDPTHGGTIVINDTEATSYPAVRTLLQDSTVQLEAKPMDGYLFDGWSGDLTSVENPANLELGSHMYVTANFTAATHTLKIEVEGAGDTIPAAGEHSYGQESEVEITAMPDDGWSFSGWGGDVTDSTSLTTNITVDKDTELIARFEPIMHTLTVNYDYDGKDMSIVGPYQYKEGTLVEVVATPESGWEFDGWAGGVADPLLESTTVLMDSDKTITASFVRSGADIRVIGIIAGAAGAGLTTFFITGRNKSMTESKNGSQNNSE